MHQEIDQLNKPTEKELLLSEKEGLIKAYRNNVVWACRALEYKKRFEREEDYGQDDFQDYINILKEDSRREVKDTARRIRYLRERIENINNKLIDLSGV